MITSYDTYSTAHVHTMWKEHISKSCGISVCSFGYRICVGVVDCVSFFFHGDLYWQDTEKCGTFFLTIEGQALDPPPAAAEGRPERDGCGQFRGAAGGVQEGQSRSDATVGR